MYHSTAARVTAVIFLAMSLFNLDTATMLFSIGMNAFLDEPVVDVSHFIMRTFNNFVRTGSVHDAPRAGRPPSVPAAVVRECAEAFKAGEVVWGIIDKETGLMGWKHDFYTTFPEAAIECQTIKKALRDYNVSSDFLLRKLHELDPSLKAYTLDFKEELLPWHKGSRKYAARDQLDKIAGDPDHLYRICWVDEWHCWCTPESCPLHIWADAHDQRAKAVLPIPQMATEDKVRIRCVVVVNALLGPIHMEFTTGTTELERELVKRPRTHEYQVSLL
jgi:hypothetical protein